MPPVDCDSQQISMLIPRTSFPLLEETPSAKSRAEWRKWDRQGTLLFRKWGKRKHCRIPATVLGKGPTVTWWHTAPNAFANKSASQLLISYGFKDLCSLSILETQAVSQMTAEAAHGWQLMLWDPASRIHCPLLETPNPTPRKGTEDQHAPRISKKTPKLSAQEASQRQQATLVTLPCLIQHFEEGCVNAFWKSCS